MRYEKTLIILLEDVSTNYRSKTDDLEDIFVTVTIQEYVQLQTARTISFKVDHTTTVEDAMTYLSKKTFLHENIKDFGLFLPKGKKLDPGKQFSALKSKVMGLYITVSYLVIGS
jgi:hypothetical protein